MRGNIAICEGLSYLDEDASEQRRANSELDQQWQVLYAIFHENARRRVDFVIAPRRLSCQIVQAHIWRSCMRRY